MPSDDFDRRLHEAQAYIDLRRWSDAEKAARFALAMEPDHYEAHGLLAQALIGSGDLNESMKVARRMVTSAPESEWGFRQLAVGLLYTGQPKEALSHIRESLRLNPENEIGLSVLCDIQRRLKQKTPARETAERLLALYPDNVTSHLAMAETAVLRRKWKEATSHSEQALGIDPENEQAFRLLGFALMKQDRDAESIDVLHRGVLLYPDDEQLQADLKWISDLYVGSTAAAIVSLIVPGAFLIYIWDMLLGKRRRIARLSVPAQAYVRQRLRIRNSIVLREGAFLISTLTWGIWLWLWINLPERAPDTLLKMAIFASAVLVSGWSGWSAWRWLKLKRGLL